MNILQVPSPGQPASHVSLERRVPSVGWFVRRSILWALLVTAGIGAACLLYAAGTNADPEPRGGAVQITKAQMRV